MKKTLQQFFISHSNSAIHAPGPLKRKLLADDIDEEECEQDTPNPVPKRKGSRSLPAEIVSLPQLSELDRRVDPLATVWEIWTHGIAGSRPLKDVSAAAKTGQKKYEGRKTREVACKMKLVSTAIEQICLDGKTSSQAMAALRPQCKSLDGLAKKIGKSLSESGLTTKGEARTAEELYEDERYKSCDLFWIV